MEHIYLNRDGEEIKFTLGDDEFIMEGGKHCRFGIENNSKDTFSEYTFADKTKGEYTFVDPAGGPMIERGTNMGIFHKDWDGLKIDKIKLQNGVVKLEIGYMPAIG